MNIDDKFEQILYVQSVWFHIAQVKYANQSIFKMEKNFVVTQIQSFKTGTLNK